MHDSADAYDSWHDAREKDDRDALPRAPWHVLTIAHLPDVRGQKVLEIGCGRGVFARYLAEQGAEVVAADFSPVAHFCGRRPAPAHPSFVRRHTAIPSSRRGTRQALDSEAVARREHGLSRYGRTMPARDVVRRALLGLLATSPGRRLLAVAMSDDAQLTRLLNTLSDRVAVDASFAAALERSRDTVDRFEDCVWLLGSNVLNHGVSRLMIDEAAYLYRLVRSLSAPAVVEIGRYRGGTTFLLAAAGGRVLSLDVDPATAESDTQLRRALERYGLSERVTTEIADSQTFPVEPAAYDIVFVDGNHTYEGARTDVERWLPGVTAGGHLILHDAFHPTPERAWARPWKVEGVHRLREELIDRSGLELAGRAGTLAHFVKAAPKS